LRVGRDAQLQDLRTHVPHFPKICANAGGAISAAIPSRKAPMIESFRDLTVWQKSMDLVVQVYAASEKVPRAEQSGLVSQIRRAAVSIPSNIAEGKAVGGRSYSRHIRIALGSRSELETQIELLRRLKMLNDADAEALLRQATEVGRMLAGLLKSLLPRN
jgi:four helix bundle protein